MQQRRQRKSHTKSRRGCLNCKQRHIKCDQQGPPCANCVARSSDCTYPASASRPSAAGAANPTTTSSSSSRTALSPYSLTALAEAPKHLLYRSPSPQILTSSAPLASSPSPAASRLLELELLHRWSTRSYRGFCSIPRDHALMQVEVPQKALRYDWLLDSMFAFAALDIGASAADAAGPGAVQAARYNRVAMEYYGRAVRSFRTAVSDMTLENHDSLYLISVAVAVIHLAALRVPRGPEDGAAGLPSVLGAMPRFFDLMRGVALIAYKCYAWMLESIESVRIVNDMPPATKEAHLDADTCAALERLERVNDALHGVASGSSGSESGSSESVSPSPPRERGLSAVVEVDGGVERRDAVSSGTEDVAVEAHQVFAVTLPHLVRAFAEYARGDIDVFWLSFPITCGRKFKNAIERSDPMALLVLMHWAVLMEWEGRKAWWTRDLGRRLIAEISAVLETSEFVALLPDFRDAMMWARSQVGLPEQMMCEPFSGFEVLESNKTPE